MIPLIHKIKNTVLKNRLEKPDNDLKKHFEAFKEHKPNHSAQGKKKIMFIRPPFMSPQLGPPIGLAFLQHLLQTEGHKVLVWDMNLELKGYKGLGDFNRDFIIPESHPAVGKTYEKLKEYCEQILDLKPDIIGFSLSYPTVRYGIELAKKLSKYTRCIAGGPQASFHESSLLELGCLDTVVSGYGEEGMLKALYSKGIISERLNPSKEYLPDYTGIEIEKYNGLLPIVTTRGCPNNCTFCTQNHPYFYHSIDSVIEQIETTPNIKKVMYNDSNINVNHKRTEELFSRLSKLSKKPDSHVFGMEIRDGFERYIPLMAESGVIEARLGIESGSVRERRSMNKPSFRNDQIVALIKYLTSNRIIAWAQFIFCYPDQTEKDRQQTLDLMRRINDECDPKYVKHFWYKFVVHHGTEQFFKDRYNVHTISPQNWTNPLYNPDKIKIIHRKYKKLIPDNAKIFL